MILDPEYTPKEIAERWEVLDRPRPTDDGGLPLIDPDREVLAHSGYLLPTDERTDEFVGMPVRVSDLAGVGIVLEIGPFTLDPRDVARLVDAIGAYYRMGGGAR